MDKKTMKWINLKVISDCNRNCHFCYEEERQGNALSTKDVLNVINQMKDSGIKALKISGGEPLLHPEILTLVQHTKKQGIRIQMATNGDQLDETLLKALDCAGLDELYVSLGDDLSEQAIKNIGKWMTFKSTEQLELRIGVNIILCKSDLDRFDSKLLLLYTENIRHLYIIPPKSRITNPWYEEEKLGLKEQLKLFKIIQYYKNQFDFILDCSLYWVHQFESAQNSCNAGVSGLAIANNGDVYPCSFLKTQDQKIGNIKEKDLNDIMDSLALPETSIHCYGCIGDHDIRF